MSLFQNFPPEKWEIRPNLVLSFKISCITIARFKIVFFWNGVAVKRGTVRISLSHWMLQIFPSVERTSKLMTYNVRSIVTISVSSKCRTISELTLIRIGETEGRSGESPHLVPNAGRYSRPGDDAWRVELLLLPVSVLRAFFQVICLPMNWFSPSLKFGKCLQLVRGTRGNMFVGSWNFQLSPFLNKVSSYLLFTLSH